MLCCDDVFDWAECGCCCDAGAHGRLGPFFQSLLVRLSAAMLAAVVDGPLGFSVKVDDWQGGVCRSRG